MTDMIGAGTWTKNSHTIYEGDSGVTRVTEQWNGAESTYATFKASYDVGDAHGTYTNCDLQPFTPKFAAAKGTVTLVYEDPELSLTMGVGGGKQEPPPPPGTTHKSSDSNPTEIPLRLHPNASATWFDPAESNYKEGIEAYLIPQPTYTYVEIVDNWTWTSANLRSGVGEISAPTGLTVVDPGADTNAWLMVDKQARDLGDGLTEVTRTWQFTEDGWDTDIY